MQKKPRAPIKKSTLWILLIHLWFTGTAKAEDDYVLWITWEQRPIFLTDPATGKLGGIYMQIIKYLHSFPELSDYEIKQVMVNHSRFNRVAQSPDNCYLGWVTFDDKRVESRTITLIKPWAIWTLPQNQNRFGKPDSLLSLEEMIEDSNITVGVIRNFTYSDPVLALLKKHNGNPTIMVDNTSAIEINPRKLNAERLDVFLGNPGQMQRKKSDPLPEVAYIKYGIREANRHRRMLVSCADDAKGRAVVAKVNQLIDRNPEDFYRTVLGFHDAWASEITPSFIEQFQKKVYPIDFSL